MEKIDLVKMVSSLVEQFFEGGIVEAFHMLEPTNFTVVRVEHTPDDWLLWSKRYRKRPYYRRFESNTLRKIQYLKVTTWPVLRGTKGTVPST